MDNETTLLVEHNFNSVKELLEFLNKELKGKIHFRS